MRIDALTKRLALRDLYEDYSVEPGSGLLYHELQRLWDRTGLRRADLEEALADALSSGDLAELYTHEGRMAVLTECGHEHAQQDPGTLRQIEAHAKALTALEWARRRRRYGVRSGRRRNDMPRTH